MRLEVVQTEDGSHTLYVPELDENYHSVKGAIHESRHVFINAGFMNLDKSNVKIFEVGFGTGLNALLTYLEAQKNNINVIYHAIEKFPLDNKLLKKLNYINILGRKSKIPFEKIHNSQWNLDLKISDFFCFKKIKSDLNLHDLSDGYDLIYFDAFAPDVQPGIWCENNFRKIKNAMNPNGILTTYSSKSSIRRTLKSLGFEVEKLPGPPGKREIIRASVLKSK